MSPLSVLYPTTSPLVSPRPTPSDSQSLDAHDSLQKHLGLLWRGRHRDAVARGDVRERAVLLVLGDVVGRERRAVSARRGLVWRGLHACV